MDNTSISKLPLIEFREGFFLNLLGKSGWYIVTNNNKHGPYKTIEIAESIAFYDRYYG